MPAQGLLNIPSFLRPKGMEPVGRNRRKGFTLIELMVVVTIIAVLSSVGYVTYANSQAVARDAKRRMDLRSVVSALELYYQQNNHTFPIITVKSTAVGTSWTNLLSGDINQMPLDPINNSIQHYEYYYSSSTGKSYLLCTQLEKPQPTDKLNGCSSPYNFGIPGLAF